MVCVWLGESSSYSCSTVLSGPAWVLLNRIYKPYYVHILFGQSSFRSLLPSAGNAVRTTRGRGRSQPRPRAFLALSALARDRIAATRLQCELSQVAVDIDFSTAAEGEREVESSASAL